MISNKWVAVSFAILAITSALDDLQSEKFCEKFPTLHMCRLRDELTGSLVELQYLLHDGETAAGLGLPIGIPAMQKRKSAFVRFGKRSVADEDSMEMEKRKSAFVRFGRAFGGVEPEKRKSQYIRFGK